VKYVVECMIKWKLYKFRVSELYMKRIKFQGTVIKYLLALLVISVIISFTQDGNLINDPEIFMGILGIFIVLFLVISLILFGINKVKKRGKINAKSKKKN
jgi:hypothetical protein